MSTNWAQVKKQIRTLREYLKQIPSTGTKQHACLITTDEIERLLAQKNDGSKLDGLRIYMGAEKDGNNILPMIAAIVACEKDTDGSYHDFNVPEKNLRTLTLNRPVEEALSPLGKALPCPTFCSKVNALNR